MDWSTKHRILTCACVVISAVRCPGKECDVCDQSWLNVTREWSETQSTKVDELVNQILWKYCSLSFWFYLYYKIRNLEMSQRLCCRGVGICAKFWPAWIIISHTRVNAVWQDSYYEHINLAPVLAVGFPRIWLVVRGWLQGWLDWYTVIDWW